MQKAKRWRQRESEGNKWNLALINQEWGENVNKIKFNVWKIFFLCLKDENKNKLFKQVSWEDRERGHRSEEI